MRYFAMFLMLFSLGFFALGCGEEKKETKPGVEKKEGGEAGGEEAGGGEAGGGETEPETPAPGP